MARPYFNNQAPRIGMPNFFQSSNLRSPRDKDSVARQWLKEKEVAANATSFGNALRQIQNQLNRLRIRSSQQSQAVQSTFTGEYAPAQTYSAGQIVIISVGANAGTYAYINNTPSSGNNPWAGGGYWTQLPGNPTGVWL